MNETETLCTTIEVRRMKPLSSKEDKAPDLKSGDSAQKVVGRQKPARQHEAR